MNNHINVVLYDTNLAVLHARAQRMRSEAIAYGFKRAFAAIARFARAPFRTAPSQTGRAATH